jgi:hypothetical protein
MSLKLGRFSLCLAAAAATVALASGRADAQSRAWAEAQKALPAGMEFVVGLNLATIRSTALYQQFVPLLLSQSAEAKQGLDLVKSTCGLDATSAIDSVVIAGKTDGDKGVAFVSFAKGIDEATVGTCMNKIFTAKKLKVAAKKGADGIVELDNAGDKVYFAFVAKDTAAFAFDPEDRATLATFIGGKGAGQKDALYGQVAKVNTNAAIWGAANPKSKEKIDGTNATMQMAYGIADYVKGTIGVEAHLVTTNAAEATGAAAALQKEVDNMKKGGGVPPAFQNVLKTLSIQASGPEVVVKVAVAEKEVLGLVGMMMQGGF